MSQSAIPLPSITPVSVLAPLSNREVRELKSRSQRLHAVTKLGKSGLSAEFILGVEHELAQHELIKIKLTELKEQRFELAEQMAARTRSHLIWVIGHVIVLYRQKSATDVNDSVRSPAIPVSTTAPTMAASKGTAAPAQPATWKAIGVVPDPKPSPKRSSQPPVKPPSQRSVKPPVKPPAKRSIHRRPSV